MSADARRDASLAAEADTDARAAWAFLYGLVIGLSVGTVAVVLVVLFGR